MSTGPQGVRVLNASLASRGAAPGFRFFRASPWHIVALGGGVGLSPHMPGTLGTCLGGVLGSILWPMHPLAALVALAALLVLGAEASGRAGRALGAHDHNAIVVDEVFGMAAVAAFLPPGWAWFVLSFVLFRLFDTLKPWPIRLADRRLINGFGVMADDALASLYTLAVVWLAWSIAS